MSSVTYVMTALGLGTATAAVARSTWSPCGWSMLSTITPVGEWGRGNRYGNTAAWFVAGATLGGVMLGGLAAAMAAGVAALHLSRSTVLVLAGTGALMAAAGDSGLGGVEFPVFRRQVNERWLDQFRSWFYGAGFGWQIGVGLATYIMTAAVFLLVALGALSGSPLIAVTIGTWFGLGRGMAVLLTRRLTTPEALRAFHRRFDALGPPVRTAVVAVEMAVALIAAGLAWAPLAGIVGFGLGAAVLCRRAFGRQATGPGALNVADR